MKIIFPRLIIVLATVLVSYKSIAGELSILSGSPIEFDTQFVDPDLECTHRFSGTFHKGDSDKIIRANPSILCLDSPGGSFVEALKVTSFMKSTSVATKIENGSRCESACALVFMAGSYHPHESEVSIAWRILHASGKLGFHSPALIVSEGVYDGKTIQKAYQLAMKSVSKLVVDLVHRPDSGGPAIKTSLLGELLATPSSSMLFVETVDQAGRWEIFVNGIKETKSPDKNQLAKVCGNIFYWDDDQSADSQFSPTTDFWLNEDNQNSSGLSGTVIMSEMTGSGCKFQVNDNYVSVRTSADGRDSYSVVNALMYYDANLRLVDLPPASGERDVPGRINGQCIIIRDGKEFSRKQCLQTQKISDGILSKTYQMPSGSQVLIETQNSSTFFDGTKTSQPFQFDDKSCVINPKQGSLFCFSAS